jgi:UPF0755 protein
VPALVNVEKTWRRRDRLVTDIVPLTAPAHRPHRPRTGRGCAAVLIALIILVAAIGVVVWRGTGLVSGWLADPDDYSGDGSGSVQVEILEGDSATDIAATLEKADVVASAEAFTDAAEADPRSLSIQPGVYELREQMSAQAALSLLVGGESAIDDSVTVPEGLTVGETIERLVDDGGLSRSALVRAAGAPQRLGLPAWAGGDLEGYLFPSTYRIQPRADEADALAQMVTEFSRQASALSLVDRAGDVQMSPREIVIVASLVQAEASRPQDFGKVARTIYNRLDAGMRLQLDSTVHFAAGDEGGDVFTTDEQRDNPSLYNTYRHKGLPPGAIDSPGQRALEAALDAPPGDWLYFVTVDLETGRTLFADTFAEHQRNADKLKAFCTDSDLC